ncbi:MAG: sugar ABC transporter ATP-binding protein [Verrucomicrobiae bacterium]|nr:sugar ABC transporter ATP-binding protein [Verrucomicrobiae bacterium]
MSSNGHKPEILVRMVGISKRFGANQVLHNVNLEIRAGEVLVLAGENGAGKSTLIKILGGVYPDFEGEIWIGGRLVRPRSPLEASALGVAVIYQELSLVPTMTVADNVFLGRALAKYGFVDRDEQRRLARELLDQLGIEIPVDARIEELPLAQQQLTEIAKALARNARVIVMDEPTSALNAPEVEKLFYLVEDLKRRGCGIVYITHKMEEIQRIADRITVLRDGEHIGTAPAKDLPPARLIQWLVGREIEEQFPRHTSVSGAERLRLQGFTVLPKQGQLRPPVEDVNLVVHAGEVVGIGGLQGSGASDLLMGLFGAYGENVRGEAWLDGQRLRIRTPYDAISQGVALLTNDRKATGLVLSMSVTGNATLAALRTLSVTGWRRPSVERSVTASVCQRVSLRAASLDMEVEWLSGGNQQKVAIAKWLQTNPRLLMLDEPTRGIDVGAKREIYQLIDSLTKQGIAILLITSELPELLAMSDRIVVLHRGRVTAHFNRAQATPESVLAAAMGRITEPEK